MTRILPLALLFLLSACSRVALLEEPYSPTGIDAQGNPLGYQLIAQAVREGAYAKRWSILEEQPTAIVLVQNTGGHQAMVQVSFDNTSWIIRYYSSSPGLRYEDLGDRRIVHKRYNLWVRNLNAAIENAVTRIRFNGPPPAPAPPTSGGYVPPPPQQSTAPSPFAN